jgi:predicted O-methyltransferase YrrM
MSQRRRREHLEQALSNLQPGHVLEFGVGNGRSLRWILLSVLETDRVFGFDSFEGLPEDWQLSETKIYPKGSFKVEQPTDINTNLYVGIFENTIPTWKKEHPGGISFIHIDSDLYSSCNTILTQLNDRIVPGTVLCFDDIYSTEVYDFWQDGEYRAFTEWKNRFGRETYELGRGDTGEASFRVIV